MATGNPGGQARSASAKRYPGPSYLFCPVFLILAVYFVWGAVESDISSTHAVGVDASVLSDQPRRVILTDPPMITMSGFRRTCMSCHRMFPPRADTPKRFLQHSHVTLNHGINDRCRNCHWETDRDRLVLRGGEVIGYNDVVKLCAKCHGLIFRDWERGAHGRTNGYWDAERGEVRRLLCTQCHDPHNPRVPAMDPLEPLPGPHTLRMPEAPPGGHGEHTESRDPLRKYKKQHGDTPQAEHSDSEAEHS
jgi:hypothetical protein